MRIRRSTTELHPQGAEGRGGLTEISDFLRILKHLSTLHCRYFPFVFFFQLLDKCLCLPWIGDKTTVFHVLRLTSTTGDPLSCHSTLTSIFPTETFPFPAVISFKISICHANVEFFVSLSNGVRGTRVSGGTRVMLITSCTPKLLWCQSNLGQYKYIFLGQ